MMEEEGCVVLAPLGPNPEPRVGAMIPGAPLVVSWLPLGEARRNAAPQVPCSPRSSSPTPAALQGTQTPKLRACNLARASAKGKVRAGAPRMLLGVSELPHGPRSLLLRCPDGAGEPRARGAAAQSSAVQLWQEPAASPPAPWVGSSKQRQCHAWVKTPRGESSATTPPR